MTKRIYLSGVGIVALSGALAASPAYASNSESVIVFDEIGVEALDDSASDTSTSSAKDGLLSDFDLNAVRERAPIQRDVFDPRTAPKAPTEAPLETFAGLQDYTATVNLAVPRIEVGPVGPDPRLLVRDDVGVDFGDPDNLVPSAVHIFIQDNVTGGIFFNCSGTVINPRTILTAAHCVNGSDGPIATTSSETYGLPGEAATSLLIATGQNSADRLFTYIGDGSGYADGGVATSTDVIIHPTGNPDNVGLGFPWADVALIAVDAPITDVPAMPILLSPLSEVTHVLQVGYGTNGTGLTGGTNAGNRFLRRVGENMVGMLGSTGDFIDGVFTDFTPSSQLLGFESQPYYWTDFDNPDRTPEEQAGCSFPGATISCGTLADVLAIDFFDGDALPGEAGTGPGDSGSALIADEIYDTQVAIGVLSGGFDFFGLGNRYSDVSFYNPLFPFFEFITENTAYKYVSAVRGDGNWSDPTHWTQDLDPGFLVYDGSGNIVNGIPTGNEPGIFDTSPRFGSILGTDIAGGNTDITPGFETIDTTVPESSVLLGPGSTGFVPNNTDGIVGTAFDNPAQYFEVHLNRRGTTTVDLDVEIDRLVIDHRRAGLVVDAPWVFTSLTGVEQLNGDVEINGTLNTSIYTLGSGELSGDGGTIVADALFNVDGMLSAGGANGFGSLTIDGDYVQTSAGTLWGDFSVGRRNVVTADSYDITGAAILDGELVLSSRDRRVRFGSEFTLLTAGSIDGDFAEVTFISRSALLAAEHRIEGNSVIVEITARSIRDILGRGSTLRSLGTALDTLRARSDSFVGLFDVLDSASFDTLGATLNSLAPVSAFNQTFSANSFSQRFTGQIAQRTLALRGGSRAAGGFSAAGNTGFALAGTTPGETGALGVFGSASGVFLNGGQQSGVLGNSAAGFGTFGTNGAVTGGVVGANAFEQASLTQAGEMTIGADLQVAEGFSFGVAVSNIRNSQQTTNVLQAQADRSQSVAIYASWTDGGLFADGYAGTSSQEFGTDRVSQGEFANAYTNAIGQSDGSQTFGGMRLGYAFDLARGVEVGPVASLDYVRNSLAGYDEVGAGEFGLSIADRTFTSMGAKMGAMASFDIATSEKGSISAFGSVAYARELADTSDVVTARFFGAADTPFTFANALDPQWVSINAGAEMNMGDNLTASLSVTSDMGRGALSNDQGRVSLSWRF